MRARVSSVIAFLLIVGASPALAGVHAAPGRGQAGWLKSLLVTSSFSPRLGSGMGPSVLRIVNDGAARFPLPPGWSVADVHIEDPSFTVTLTSPGLGTTAVRFLHKYQPRQWRVAGHTLSFRAETTARDGTSAAAACDALIRRISSNDKVYFYSGAAMAGPESRDQFLYRYYFYRPLFIHGWLPLAACAAFLYLLLSNCGGLGGRLAPGSARAAAALVVLFAAGLVLRLTISPAAPIHCNAHGIEEIRAYVSPPVVLQSFPFNYGHIFPASMRALVSLAGGGDGALFLLNRIFGALAALAMFMFVRALLKSDAAALAAAAFLALSPGQIWLSGTESQIPLFLFTALSGLALTCAAIRIKNIGLFAAAAILVSYSCSLRILTVLLVPCAGLIALYCALDEEEKPSPMFIRAAGAIFAASLAWAAFYYMTIPHLTARGVEEFNPRILAQWFVNRRNILYDPTLTPITTPILASLGFIAAVASRRKFAALTGALFLIAVPLTFTITDCRTSAVRYQLQSHWVYYLAAAFAVMLLCEAKKHPSAARAALFAAGALFFANSVYGCALLAKGDEEMHEYRFMRRAAAMIPEGSPVLIPVTKSGRGRLNTEFPDYVNNLKNDVPKMGRNIDLPGAGEYVYIGLDCYRYADRAEMSRLGLPGGMSRECADACRDRLSPIVEKKLDTRHPSIGFQKRFFDFYNDFVTIGMYRCEKANEGGGAGDDR